MEASVKEILVASLLGDGWLKALSGKRETSTYYAKYHSKNVNYLLWLRDQVKELSPSELKAIPKYPQYYFYTKARTDIGELRRLFYPNEGRKIVPDDIDRLLKTPKALAIWYQDDGTLDKRFKYHFNAMFATYCFTYEECCKLAKMLAVNFGIQASVCKCQMRGKMYFRLYILSESMGLFIKTIKPYIHPVFNYKISLL